MDTLNPIINNSIIFITFENSATPDTYLKTELPVVGVSNKAGIES